MQWFNELIGTIGTGYKTYAEAETARETARLQLTKSNASAGLLSGLSAWLPIIIIGVCVFGAAVLLWPKRK